MWKAHPAEVALAEVSAVATVVVLQEVVVVTTIHCQDQETKPI